MMLIHDSLSPKLAAGLAEMRVTENDSSCSFPIISSLMNTKPHISCGLLPLGLNENVNVVIV